MEHAPRLLRSQGIFTASALPRRSRPRATLCQSRRFQKLSAGLRRWVPHFVAIATVLALVIPSFADEPADAIVGIWHTTDDKSQVEIFKRDKEYCAKIISLKEPNW